MKSIAKFLDHKTDGFKPTVGIVLGSGLGSFTDNIDIKYSIPYDEIDGFPVSTIQGHDGKLIFGTLDGVNLMVMKGRFHYYEGYSIEQVVMPIRIMALMGVKKIMLSNAAGALNLDYNVGDMMLINNHINFIPNPLIGKNNPEYGERFPDMKEPYSLELIEKTIEHFPNLKQGVYVATTGPSYETKAEVNFFRMIGGDTVGMSTVPEAITARHHNMEVFALSLITNVTNGSEPLTHQEVMDAGEKAKETMTKIFKFVISL